MIEVTQVFLHMSLGLLSHSEQVHAVMLAYTFLFGILTSHSENEASLNCRPIHNLFKVTYNASVPLLWSTLPCWIFTSELPHQTAVKTEQLRNQANRVSRVDSTSLALRRLPWDTEWYTHWVCYPVCQRPIPETHTTHYANHALSRTRVPQLYRA